MFVCVVLIAGGGYYYSTTLGDEEDDDDDKWKKSGSCEGMDVNGVYEYDENGECVFKGCKSGYYQQDGICIKSRDLSSEFLGGGESLDCVIDGYTYGQCMNKVTGQPLTGETGNCGIGTREKYPRVSASAIGRGECEAVVNEECEVSCPTTCGAPDSLWMTDENAECRAIRDGQSVVLGPESGYCGQGTKVKTFSDNAINAINADLLGTMSLDEYKNSINFSSCEPERVEACSVPCGEDLVDVGCPTSLDSWDWVYANQGAVYTPESAEQVIRREIGIGDAVLMPAISRQEAIDLGALNVETGEIDETRLPRGKKILFKAGEQHSYEYLKEQNCSIVQLEDVPAPRIAEDCVIENVEGQCSVVGCGVPQQKTITPTVTKPAWGAGTCNKEEPYTKPCEGLYGPQCCIPGNKQQYTKTGTCDENGKQLYTYNPEKCILVSTDSDDATFEEDCCYVGEWVKGECNQDDQLDKVKYTRTVVNQNMCSRSKLLQNVEDGETFDIDKPTIKYVQNVNECYSTCEVEKIGGHKAPYDQRWGGGGFAGGDPYHTSCYGTVTYRVTKAGKGSGLSHWSCTNNNAKNYALGDEFDGVENIGTSCP